MRCELATIALGLLLCSSFVLCPPALGGPGSSASEVVLAVEASSGSVVAACDAVGISTDEPNEPSDPNEWVGDFTERITELAQNDHIALLEWACQRYEKHINCYQITLYKQERIRRKLKAVEEVDVRFLEKPFSVFMKWKKNAGRGDKILYVDGAHDGKMIVHPTGLWSWIKSVKKDPRSKDVKRASLKTPDQFGFHRGMTNMLDIYREAKENGDLRINYIGPTKVKGRPCVAMERVLPADKGYPFARLLIEFDVEYVLPTSITCYDWSGQLMSRYVYGDLRFNTGLTEADFTPAANGL